MATEQPELTEAQRRMFAERPVPPMDPKMQEFIAEHIQGGQRMTVGQVEDFLGQLDDTDFNEAEKGRIRAWGTRYVDDWERRQETRYRNAVETMAKTRREVDTDLGIFEEDAEDIRNLLDKGRLSPTEARKALQKVFDGVESCRARIEQLDSSADMAWHRAPAQPPRTRRNSSTGCRSRSKARSRSSTTGSTTRASATAELAGEG